jgi:hypothetical protein
MFQSSSKKRTIRLKMFDYFLNVPHGTPLIDQLEEVAFIMGRSLVTKVARSKFYFIVQYKIGSRSISIFGQNKMVFILY